MKKVSEIMTVIIVIYLTFFVGFDVAKHNYELAGALAGALAIIGSMWTAIGLVAIFINKRDDKELEKLQAEIKQRAEDLIEAIDSRKTETLSDSHHDELGDILMGIVHDVTGHKPPTEADVAEIKKRFEIETDHFIQLKLEPGGMTVRIGSTPFDPIPDPAAKQEAKASSVSSVDGIKSVSKSQQRRKAASKPAKKG